MKKQNKKNKRISLKAVKELLNKAMKIIKKSMKEKKNIQTKIY